MRLGRSRQGLSKEEKSHREGYLRHELRQKQVDRDEENDLAHWSRQHHCIEEEYQQTWMKERITRICTTCIVILVVQEAYGVDQIKISLKKKRRTAVIRASTPVTSTCFHRVNNNKRKCHKCAPHHEHAADHHGVLKYAKYVFWYTAQRTTATY